jgi:CheY-like chemotaxis protein
MNQRVIEVMMKSLGSGLEIVDCGEAGLKAANEKEYDLIFMDIGLPDIDGLEVTRRIRKNKGPNQEALIIVLTAHVQQEDCDNCFAAGADDVVSKPILLPNLENILYRHLSA